MIDFEYYNELVEEKGVENHTYPNAQVKNGRPVPIEAFEVLVDLIGGNESRFAALHTELITLLEDFNGIIETQNEKIKHLQAQVNTLKGTHEKKKESTERE